MLIGVQSSQPLQISSFFSRLWVYQHEAVAHFSHTVLIGHVGTDETLGTHVKHLISVNEVHEQCQVESFVSERIVESPHELRLCIADHCTVVHRENWKTVRIFFAGDILIFHISRFYPARALPSSRAHRR